MHEWQDTGHGPKGLDSGCSCGLPTPVKSEWKTHKFMREWFAIHPDHPDRATDVHPRFQHWIDNEWV